MKSDAEDSANLQGMIIECENRTGKSRDRRFIKVNLGFSSIK